MFYPSWGPYMSWLSSTELDKAMVHVIRLSSFLWLWFQSVCPLMPSLRAYHLFGVSLTLDMGYLFMAAPAKRSRYSLPWTWGVSSWPPLLTMMYHHFWIHLCPHLKKKKSKTSMNSLSKCWSQYWTYYLGSSQVVQSQNTILLSRKKNIRQFQTSISIYSFTVESWAGWLSLRWEMEYFLPYQ